MIQELMRVQEHGLLAALAIGLALGVGSYAFKALLHLYW